MHTNTIDSSKTTGLSEQKFASRKGRHGRKASRTGCWRTATIPGQQPSNPMISHQTPRFLNRKIMRRDTHCTNREMAHAKGAADAKGLTDGHHKVRPKAADHLRALAWAISLRVADPRSRSRAANSPGRKPALRTSFRSPIFTDIHQCSLIFTQFEQRINKLCVPPGPT